jgi:SAM-dependent methyltransferase
MDALRRLHNQQKRRLIERVVTRGAYVLDCGCGRGGDLHKWSSVGALVIGVDPDPASIEEARVRKHDMNIKTVQFDVGDIFVGKLYGPFDIICYNFSIHYIVQTLQESAKAIAEATKVGGLLIGITPDIDRIQTFVSPDALGNTIEMVDASTASVRLVDGPFYAQGARQEPVISRAVLEQALRPWFMCLEWKPMVDRPNGLVSDVYSTFIFRRF